MKPLAIIAFALLGLIAAGCSESKAPAPPRSAPVAPKTPPDYTVVAKNVYSASAGGGTGKTGYYVTIVLFGAERETRVSSECYSTPVGAVLHPNCR